MWARKLPVEVRVWQWTGIDGGAAEPQWVKEAFQQKKVRMVAGANGNAIIVTTLEGDMALMPNDYLIEGVKGEFYPIKEETFNLTYEIVPDEVATEPA